MPRSSHSTPHGGSHSGSSTTTGGSRPSSSAAPVGGHSAVDYTTMENFGQHLDGVRDRVFSSAETMQSLNFGAHTFGVVGQGLAGGASATTSHAAQQMHSVGGSIGQASDNVRTMTNNYRHTDQSAADAFGAIHDPANRVHAPHASTSGSTPPRQVGFDPNTQVHHPDGTQTTGTLNDNSNRPSPRPNAGQLNPSAYQPITGANTHHLTGPPEPGNHPLRVNDSGLTTASYMNSQGLANGFSGKTRPGMGGALLIGDHVMPHSSMKPDSGPPNRHNVVQQVLDQTPPDRRGNGHGNCAEVGAISDYLHNQDPNGQWSVQDARHHFEQVGAATTAHAPSGGGRPTDACQSCQYLTGQLGISWYTRPVWEANG
jgi:hypothetical protein